MPNWCSNVTILSHPDKAKADALIESLKNGVFFEFVLPLGEWEYEKACNTWGTKWEADGISWMRFTEDVDRIELNYETAWCPPQGILEKLNADGWFVRSYYCEEGMGFIGKYETTTIGGENVLEDESYNFDDKIPEEFGNVFFWEDWHSDSFELKDGFYTQKESSDVD